MKKLMTTVLLICIIALMVVTLGLCDKVQEKEKDLIAQEEKMKQIETRIVELEENKTTEQNKKEQEVSKETENLGTLNVKFDPNKIKTKTEGMKYKNKIQYVDSITGMSITLEEGKVYLYTEPDNQTHKEIFPKATKKLEGQEITGFSSNIVEVHFAYFGTDVSPAKIVFLMEDGTVEYADSKKIIENSEFVSAGKIEGISNIVKIESVEVEYYDETGNSEGGAGTNVAIDKEGYAYDLSELGLNK